MTAQDELEKAKVRIETFVAESSKEIDPLCLAVKLMLAGMEMVFQHSSAEFLRHAAAECFVKVTDATGRE